MFPAASPDRAEAAQPTQPVDRAGLVVVLLYALSQITLAILHDPWLDEAQAWMWAKALSAPMDFFIIPGEGHPPLWHWLLRLLSSVMGFSEARYLSTALAIINAFLLSRLLRDELVLLVLFLCTFVMLQFWGYHFRPYGIVLCCMLSALLLDRQGRDLASTWVLALACGFHFFSGFLFAFWLVWQLRKGTRPLQLLAPALFAAVFGVLAILSGRGNTTAGPIEIGLLVGTIQNLSWTGMIPELRTWALALLNVAALVFALRKQPVILAALLALLLVFSVATAAVYGKFAWHTAFLTMLCFMAIMVAGLNRERRLVLGLLLLPQMVFGFAGIAYRLSSMGDGAPDLYQAIKADAGAGFDPETQLVAWPDLAGVAMAAINDITIINGNGGPPLGPVHWRSHDDDAFAPALLDLPRPYWLICVACAPVLTYLEDNGRVPILLGERLNPDNGQFAAYRVD